MNVRPPAPVALLGAALLGGILLGGVLGGRAALARQAAIARARIGKPLGEDAIDADRIWRAKRAGTPIDLLMLGDSLAAGLGADRRKDTLGARLAKGLGAELDRPVRLRTAAIVGSESSDLPAQLDAVGEDQPCDVAVILVGGNDVTHRIPIAVSVAHLQDAITRLRARGIVVVVGTCPDLGALRAVPQPLRSLAAQSSRRLAAAQRAVALRSGALPLDLAGAVGQRFRSDPESMFSVDRFHPSALGYRLTAQALLPSLVEALQTPREPARSAVRLSAQSSAESDEGACSPDPGAQDHVLSGGARTAPIRPIRP